MPRQVRSSIGPPRVGADLDFSSIRAEFDVPSEFPPEAVAEAERAAAGGRQRSQWSDLTQLPLVTIDPPGAKDLDQALLIDRRPGGGFRIHYAITDLGFFVTPGGHLDVAVRRRGQTYYLPDGMVPLHPTVLSEASASLLPGQVRPVVLWTIDTDSDGEPRSVVVRRALARSVARFDYDTVRAALKTGTLHSSLRYLPDVGRARRDQAVRRGAIELELPEQEVTASELGGWRLALRRRTEIDAWNAEISLLTGMSAAVLMLEAGVGLLRTLPEPDERSVNQLRRSAATLGVPWRAGASAAELLTELDSSRPESLALYLHATRLLRGAGYTAFDGKAPELSWHAGLGAPYAHVTAPLRRLVDRFCTEVCLAVSAGLDVAVWVREALPQLPAVMSVSDRMAVGVQKACVNQVEAWVLAHRVGQVFDAVVLRSDGGNTSEVFVPTPPVIAKCHGAGLAEGEWVRVRLTEADPARRRVSFEAA